MPDVSSESQSGGVHSRRVIFIDLARALAAVFMLYGHNWARWLLVAWIAFHIVVGALNGIGPLMMHIAIFSVILFFVFRRDANEYFASESG